FWAISFILLPFLILLLIGFWSWHYFLIFKQSASISKRTTTLSSLTGISLLTIYSFNSLLALILFLFPLEMTNEHTAMTFFILGISSLLLLIIWVSFSFQNYPIIARASLHIIALSGIIYISLLFSPSVR
ncbi:MAG: hypothetical protein ACK5LK_08530, partial [Chthoniobacterales bacterium]